MPYRANYPRTVREVLSNRRTYRPATLKVLREFRRAKPWRGSEAERRAKFRKLHRQLCRIYGEELRRGNGSLPTLSFSQREVACYIPSQNRINLPTLSVVTYLHEFAHVRGADERQACGWSINLFRRIFPRSYARCRHDGHMLIAGR
jgi:hypothetical protein